MSGFLRLVTRRAALAGLALLLAFAANEAAAQRAFTQRFTTNANGDMLMIGNANMTCPIGAANCAAARAGGNFADNDFTMEDIDVDGAGDLTTFNSSSATLSLPAGSTVLWAGLYWGANSGNAARNTVLFQRPLGFGYQVVTASQVDTTGSTQYGAFADVTSIVQTGGSGTYTAANIQRTLGTNQWAGWSLIVAYQNNGETLKNISIFDGFQVDPVTTTVSGFLTPLSGPITTRLGFVGYDGDRDDSSAGEAFTINGVPIVDGQNPALNFYNSTISNLGSPNTARNPSYNNTLGLDIDRVNAPAGAVTNGATSATIQLGAANEEIWIQVVAFSTDIYVPIITPNVVKTATDVNGGSFNRGDTIRYAISLSNTGQDTGTNVILTDQIPTNTTYVPGSLVITSGANAGAKSDTTGNDQAEFLTGPNRVVFRLGTGANATNGGNIAFGQSTSVQFDVTIDQTTPAGYEISNTATISYSGQTLGASFGTTSAASNATLVGPALIAKSFTPNTIANGGSSVLEIALTNPAGNPSNLTGVTFTDTYPAGLVNTGAPSPSIVCTAGSTGGTVTAAPNGNSLALSPGATIAPGGTCTVTVNVTSTTDGTYNNTTGVVQSTNGGPGTTASASLSVGKPRITKAMAPASILSGGTSTVTLTLMNPTALALTGMAFSDTLANMQVAAVPAITNTCGGTFTAGAGSGLASLAAGTLGAGASCTITFNVTSTTTGVHPNATTGVSSTQTGTAGNPSNSVTLTVIGAPVATKSFSSASTNVNVPVTLTITIANPNTTTTLTGVDFTDTYPDPAGATVQMTNDNPSNRTLNCTAGSTATATGGTAGGTTVGITGGSLLPGGSCTITVRVESTSIVAPSQAYNNSTGAIASTNGGAGAAANATLTVGTLAPPLITKVFAPASIAAGATSVMTITINNNAGAAAVTGIDFTDTYPAGLVNAATPAAGETCPAGVVTAAAGGNTLSFTGGSVNAGTSCTVFVTVTSATGGSRFNSTGPVTTTNAGTATAGSGTLNVLTPPIISKVFNPVAVATGGDATLTFTIQNTNNVALAGLGFTDVFPVGVQTRNAPAETNTCGGTFQDSGGGGIGDGDAGVRLNNDGTLAANSSCTLTVTVRGITAGTYTNTSGAVAATGPVALTGNTASAPFAVGQLNIAKAFVTPIAPGANSTLTFTISNSTGGTRTGVAFTDTYPAGLVNATPLTVGGTCTAVTTSAVAGGNTFNLTSASVVAAGCTVTVLVTSATPGSYLNQTSGLTHSTDATPGSPSNVATLVVRQRPTITKSFSPTTIVPGAASTLTLTIANANGDAMTGVGFTDTFPAGMVVHATPAASNTCGGTFERSLGGAIVAGDVGVRLVGGSIPANTTCTMTVAVTSATAGSYNNTTGAVATTNAGTGVASSAILNVLAPPTLAKSFAPATIGLNETSILTVTLTNPNASDALTGAAFTDAYPAGMANSATPNGSSSCGGTVTAVAAGNSLALSGGTIPAGGSCIVTVEVTGTTPGAKLNTTSVLTTTNAGTSAAGGSGTLTVLNVLTVTKAFAPATVGLGQTSVMTVTLTNSNTTAVTGAAFSDVYPANLVNAAVASGATTCGGSPAVTAANNGTSLAISGATVPASGACTVTVNVRSTTAGSYLNSTGTVTTANAGTAAAGSGTLTVIANTLTKAFAPATLTVGGTSTLVFTLTNGAGNPAQAGINFTDTLPAGLVIAAIPNLQSNCPAGAAQVNNPAFLAGTAGTDTITVTGAAMNAALASCTIRVDVTSSATPTTTACPAANNTNGAASITAIQNTVNGVTNQCLAVSAAAPVLTKAFSGPLTVGASTTLTFTVSQPAGNPTQTFGYTDTLPAGLVVAAGAVGGTCTGGTVTATAGTNTITVAGRQIVNPATTCTITVPITTSATPTTTACPVAANTNAAANVTGITNLTNGVTAQCVAVTAATPGLTKAFAPATITVGGTSTLSFTVSQPAGNPTQTFSFTDTLPAGLVIGAGAVGGSCSGGTVTATAGTAAITVAGRQIVNPATTCTITVPVTTSATPTTTACPVAANTNAAANVTGTTNLDNNVTAQCLAVTAATPDLTKAFSGPLTVGGTTTLTFTVTQPAGNPTQAFSFTDTLPAGLVIGSGATGGTCTGGSVTATVGTNTITVAGRQIVNPATTCTITVPITTSATPSTTACPVPANTNAAANVTATTNVTNSVTAQCVPVTAATPSLTKAFTPATLTIGGTTTLTFSVTQPAGNPTQTFSYTDTLPAGLVVGAGAVGGTCSGGTVTATAGTNTITVAGRQIVNPATTCTITIPIAASATPTTTTCPVAANTNGAANVTGTTNLANNVTDQCVAVSAATPTLTKAFGGPLTVGGTTTLSFTVTQPAGNPTQTFSFTDTLPAGLVVGAGAVGGTCSSGTVTATAGTNTITVAGRQIVNPATTCTITVPVTTSATPTTTACPVAANTNAAANVTGTTNLTNGVTPQCATVTAAVPAMTKAFSPTTITVGGTTTLTFTMTQPAGNPTQTFSFTDTLPAGLVVGAGATGGTCTAGSVTATAGTNTITVAGRQITAASCTISVPVTNSATPTTTACPVAANTNGNASVTGTTNLTNNVTDQCVTVNAAIPSLTKAFTPATLTVGGSTTLTFTVTQPAGNPTQSFSFTDTLPAGLVVGAGAVGGTCTAGSVTATAGTNTITVAGRQVSGASCTISVPVAASATPTTTACPVAANTNGAANVTGTTNLTNGVTDQCLAVTAATPVLTKAFTPDTLTVGGTTTLTFTVTQPANNPTQTFSFVDTLPAGLVVGAGAVGGTCTAGSVTATAGTATITVAGRQVTGASCTITVSITTSGTPTTTACPVAANTNGAGSISGATNLGNGVTNQCVAVSAATPTLTKAFSPTTLTVGGTTTLTFTIVQPASNPTQTFSFTDNLPAGLVLGAGGAGGTCTGGTVTATAGTATIVVAGRQVSGASCTITVPVVASATPTTTACPVAANTNGNASVSGTANLTNNVTDQCVTVSAATPSLTKAFTPATLTVGGSTTLTFTVTQPANNPTQTFSFTDTLPSGLVVGAGAVGGTCTAGSVTATAGTATITVAGRQVSGASCTITVPITNSATPNTTACPVAANTNGAANVTGTTNVSNAVTDQCVAVSAATPTLTKAFTPATLTVGATTTLTFSVTQPAGNPTQTFSFTDTLPSGLVVGTGAVGGTCTTGTVTATPGTNTITVAGRQVTGTSCTITVPVTTSATPSTAACPIAANTNGAASISGTTNLTNGVTNQCVAVSAATPDLTKAFSPATLTVGGTTTLTFLVTQPAGNPTQTFSFVDTLPSGLVVGTGAVGGTCASGTVTATAGTSTITVAGRQITGTSCTISVPITTSATPSTTACPIAANTNGNASISGETNVTNSVSNQCVTVSAATPALTKAFTPATLTIGGTTTLTFTVTQPAGNPTQTFSFVDTLPSGLVVGTGAVGGTCTAGTVTATAGSSTITVAGRQITGATCTITVPVAASATPSTAACPVAANTNGAASISGATNLASNVTDQCVAVSAATPDLTKAFTPATLTVGGSTTLTFTVTQPANNPTQTFSFTDTLPSGLVIGSGAVGGTCTAGTVTATAGSNTIAVAGRQVTGASCTITVPITTSATPSTTACPIAANTNGNASITGTTNLTNSVSNQCVSVGAATPSLSKAFSPATLTVAGTITLTFTVTQPATNPTQTFSFTDTLPTGLVVGAGAVGGTCMAGTVTATAGTNTITVAGRQVTGASCTITVPITTSATPSTTACPVAANTNGGANVTGTTNLANNVTDQCVTVSAATPTLTKAFTPAALTVGSTTTLTFTLTQPATNPTQTFSFTDTLPAGLAVGAGAVGGSCSAGTVTATAGSSTITVAGRQVSGASCTITVPITTSATPSTTACPTAANTNGAASITGTTNVANGVTDQCVAVSAATPALTKAFSPATISVGGTTTLTFTVTQPAGNPTQTFSFTDTLPSGLVVGAGAVGGTCTAGSVTATAGTSTITVAGRQVSGVSCTITVPITTSATPGMICPSAANTNGAANITGTTNLANTVTDQCVTVNAQAPTLTKAFSPATLAVGGTSTLTFTLTQPGGNPTQTFSFVDTLPAGLAVGTGAVGGTCTGGSVTATTGTSTITVTNRQIVNPAASCTITVPITTSATPSTAACPVAANTNGAASISGATNVVNGVTDQCVAVNAATPALTKAFTPATLTVGGTTTLTFTLTQPAGNPTQAVSFTDTLPTGLVLGSGGAGGTCAGGTVTATAGSSVITVAGRQVTGTGCTITVPITTSATPTTTACPVAANTNGNANVTGTTNVANNVTDQCVAVSAATPSLDKAFGGALTLGGTQTLTFTISQPASNPTQTFSFTDTLPSGLVVGTGAVGGTCASGSVTATAGSSTITVAGRQVTGASCTITVPVTTSATPAVALCPTAANTNANANISATTNVTAAITASAAGGGTSGAGACVTVTAATPTLAKAFTPATLTVGGATTLTFTVSQSTANPTQTFSFIDTLPTGLVVGTGAVGGTCSGGSVTATAGTSTITVAGRQIVNPSASCTITVPITTSATPSTTACPVAANTNGNANVTGTTNLANNVTDQCVAVSAATPDLTKAFTPATLTVGGTTTLTFSVTQATGNPTQAFSFTDTLPSGLVVGTGAVGGTCAGGTVTATAGTSTITVAGRQITGTACTITVPITTSATPSTTACPVAANTNGNANVTGNTNVTNSVSNQCLTVTAATPDLTKAFTPATLTVGGTTTLTFSVTQPASNPTQAFSFTDTLPSGLAVGTGAVGGTCTAGTVTATAGSSTITVAGRQITGASCTITVPITTSATPSTTACPVAANTNGNASITGTTNVSNSVSNQCVSVTAASPVLTKAFTPATLTVGGTTTLTFSVTQPAGNPTQTFSFTDTLPSGLVVGAGAVGGTCTAGTVTATAGTNSIVVAGRQVTGTSCTITVPITTSATPSTTACPVAANTNGAANITGTTNLTNGVTNQCVAVGAAMPDLTKAFTPATLTVGGTTTLTFSVTQPAGNPTQSFSFTDTLPAGLVVGTGAVGGTCTAGTVTATAGTSSITVAGRQLTGTSCTITVPITTSATPSTTACPVAANTNGNANVTGTTNVTNSVASQCVTVTPATPALVKSFGGTLTVGGTQTLTFTVSQPAGNPTQTFSFTDTLPSGLVVGTGAVGGTCTAGTVTATAGTSTITVAGRQVTGASCTITVPITTSATPSTTACPVAANTNGNANVTGTTNLVNNVSNQCVTVLAASPDLTKAFTPATLTVGGTTTLTFTITQPGGNPTQTFSFVDTLPAGLAVGTGAVGGTCTGGSVTATPGSATITVASRQLTGTTCTITVPITTSAAPSTAACPVAANTNGNANVTGATNVNNSVTNQCVAVTPATPSLDKTFGGALSIGGTQTLTFTVTQPAGNPTQTFSFTDTLPSGLVVGTGAVGGTCASGSVTATAGTNSIVVAGRQITGASCTITVPITTSATPAAGICPVAANTNANANITGTTNLTVAIAATAAGGGTSGAGACVTVTAATPALTKAFTPATLTVGGTTTLTFTVTQPAGNPTQTFSFTDTLPAGLVVGTGAVGGTCAAGTVTATAGTSSIVVAGRQVTGASCTITVPITTSATPTATACPVAANTNGNANVAGTTNLANNVTDQCVAVSPAAPTLTKAFTPAALTVGGTTTLTFSVTQPAGNPTQTFSFTDTLPAGLVVGTGAVGGTCSAGTVTATAGTNSIVVAGRQITGTACTITVPITTSATPSATACPVAANTNGNANITGTTNLANNVTNQCVAVGADTPDLTKAFTPATLTVGGTTTLTFTITQAAGNPTQVFSFTDTLPAGLVVGAGATGGTCTGGSVTATAGTNSIVVAGRQVTGTACTITVPITTSATPSTAACPVAANTNGNANVTGTTNLTNSVTNQCVAVSPATPALTKAFTPATLTVGGTTTLTFSVTQPAGNPTQTFSFTDTLPAGLVVGTGAVGGTCSAGTVTATAGTNSIVVAGRQITGASCTITVPITTSATPSTTACPVAANTNGNANVTGTTNLANNVTDQCVAVAPAAPTLDKSFSAALTVGGTTTLTFTISQPAANPTQTFSFTDTLPAGLAVGTGAVGGTCTGGSVTATAGSSTITVAGRQVTGASCTITVPVTTSATPTAGTCPVAANTNGNANITGTTNLTAAISNSAAGGGTGSGGACVTVGGASPTLTKAFTPATLAIGGTTTLTFTVSQPGGNPTQTFSFTDTLPAGLVVGTGAIGGTCSGGSVTATAGANTITVAGRQVVNPAASCTITVPVTTSAAYVIGACPTAANTNGAANITGTANLTNGVTPQCVAVTAAAPTIAKAFGPATISSGGVSTLTITISNTNAAPISVTSVTDIFPVTPGTGITRAVTPNTGTTCATGTVGSTAGSVTLTGGTVPANGNCTFQVDVTAATQGSYANTIAAGALTTNAGSNVAAANATLTVAAVANLSVTKAGPATVSSSGAISYTIVVANAGPDAANNANFADNVPAGITAISAACSAPTGGAACVAPGVAGNSVTATIATLPSGASVTFTIDGTAPAVGSFTNTATIAPPAGVTDPVPGNNSSSVATTVLRPDLTLSKSHAGNFTVGVNGVYTLAVSNTAGTLATSGTVTVSDTLPAGLGFVSGTGTGWACGNVGQAVTCTSATPIAAGASGNPITLTVTVASIAVPSVTNIATVSGGGEPAVLNGDNVASDNTLVNSGAVNSFAPDNAQTSAPGTSVFYPHTFTAGGAGTVGFGTTSTQTPAVGGWTQTIFRDTNCSGTLDGAEAGTALVGTVPVAAGGLVCIIVRDSIPAAAPFNAQNVIAVTSTFNGTSTLTRTDTTTVSAAAGGGLTLQKAVRNVTQGGAAGTTGTARPNDILEYTITYTNTSAGPLSNIVVTDSTPAFTQYQSGACGTLPAGITGCSLTTQPPVNGTGSIVWTFTGSLAAGANGTVSYQVRVLP